MDDIPKESLVRRSRLRVTAPVIDSFWPPGIVVAATWNHILVRDQPACSAAQRGRTPRRLQPAHAHWAWIDETSGLHRARSGVDMGCPAMVDEDFPCRPSRLRPPSATEVTR